MKPDMPCSSAAAAWDYERSSSISATCIYIKFNIHAFESPRYGWSCKSGKSSSLLPGSAPVVRYISPTFSEAIHVRSLEHFRCVDNLLCLLVYTTCCMRVFLTVGDGIQSDSTYSGLEVARRDGMSLSPPLPESGDTAGIHMNIFKGLPTCTLGQNYSVLHHHGTGHDFLNVTDHGHGHERRKFLYSS